MPAPIARPSASSSSRIFRLKCEPPAVQANLVRIERFAQVAACIAYGDAGIPVFEPRDETGDWSPFEILVADTRGQGRPCRNLFDGWPLHCAPSALAVPIGIVLCRRFNPVSPGAAPGFNCFADA